MTNQDTNDYQNIFLEDRPLMDVRAPIEFEKGAFPNSQNIPILDDLQREAIGTCYKQEGQDAAIVLGLQLVDADIREQRLELWTQFVKAHPQGYLYCFRGGLRSRTTQSWLQEQGVNYPLIRGGYKAMRTYLLQQLELSAEQIPMVISGAPCYLTKFRDSCHLNSFTYAANGICPERPASVTTTHKSRFVITPSNGWTAIRNAILASLARYRALRLSELPCRLSGTKNHHFASAPFP